VALLAFCVGLGVVLSSPTTPPNGLAGRSASQVIATAVGAARATGSLHVVETAQLGAVKVGAVGDIGQTRGCVRVSSGAQGLLGTGTVLWLPNILYVQGNATFLSAIFARSTSASALANQWVAFRSGSPEYSEFSTDDAFSSMLDSLQPHGHLSLGPVHSVDGVNVVGVAGGRTVTSNGVHLGAAVTLDVSTTAPFVPVALIERISVGIVSGIDTLQFSDWGHPVAIVAPAKSVPSTSVPGLAPSTGGGATELQPFRIEDA
jgi:hypothetical protein